MSRPRVPLILVVDDEREVREEVSRVLTAAGFECRCCGTAQSAIELAAVETPDMILADVNLDGHSGMEMCEQIKGGASRAEIPVMFLSEAQTPDVIRRRHAMGGTYYLRKPLDGDVLVGLIDSALWEPRDAAGPARRQPLATSPC